MSLTKRWLESQPEFQPTETNIENARLDVRAAINQLESIENLDQMDFELILSVANRLRIADQTLQTAINQQVAIF